jgi:hypothetical protein
VGVAERSGEGRSFILECGVSCADFTSTISYEWMRGNSSIVLGRGAEYTFNLAAQDDVPGVMYFCTATILSGLLSAPTIRIGSITISELGKEISHQLRTLLSLHVEP